ncbi:MAG: glycosyltransferase family 4 protein [Deltaproteobacteria bacterium]|nr:glycosyltransferase family 4 protein [Deltaproteobacteria bacterium]
MKILLICSGNSGQPNIAVLRQAESLQKAGLEIDFFLIKGRGLKGYIKNIKPLRITMKQNNYDILHAHYSFSAFTASIAGAKNLNVSLMGSDVNSGICNVMLIRIFRILFGWDSVIVKSRNMETRLKIKSLKVIPNGVDTDIFKPMNLKDCQKRLGWDIKKNHILFPSDPNRPEKDYRLALEGIRQVNDHDIEIHILNNVPQNEVPFYINASDTLILTSRWEGSPNVIKEAMACNCPVVSTKAGDVEWLFGCETGYYIVESKPPDVGEKLKMALAFRKNNIFTQGRQRIFSLQLDSESVVEKLFRLYTKASLKKIGNEAVN